MSTLPTAEKNKAGDRNCSPKTNGACVSAQMVL